LSAAGNIIMGAKRAADEARQIEGLKGEIRMKQFYGIILASCLCFAAATACYAQQAAAPPALEPASTFGAAREIPLYPGVAPGSENWNYSESTREGPAGPAAINVVRPVLLYFPAPRGKAIGTAMIVAPGGGNRMLMMSYEGVEVAKTLNEWGVDAFILKYRLRYTAPGPSTPQANGPATSGPQAGQNISDLLGADGRQAVNLLRTHAAEFGFQPDRIGMIGYSAGGGPIRAAISGPAETRPNFAAMIYAAVNHGDAKITAPAGAPPLFLAVAADDQAVGYKATLETFEAWREANIPVELHIFQMGAHGFRKKGGGADHYMDRVKEWMQVNGWLTQPR
jgi:acetyl esterase/lipase